MKNFKSILELQSTFNTELKCRKHLEKIRWNGTPCCVSCGSVKVYRIEKGKRFVCGEKECKHKFSVKSGTIFENSNIPLQKWFLAMYLATSHKKGISSIQLSKDIGVTQKTAWFVLHRIREMLKEEQVPQQEDGTFEIDETYVGGKLKNKHKKDKKRLEKGGYVSKVPVLGMLKRDGKVITHVVRDNSKQALEPHIFNRCLTNSTIITDAHSAYYQLSKYYNHLSVCHDKGEYTKGHLNQYHTNTIEGFWSLLKRGIIGIYHCVSPKHIQSYCDEFAYRYNTRDLKEDFRFHQSLALGEGKRLKYSQLINKTV